MDRTIEIVYGDTSATVYTYPPQVELAAGVPSSATCSVYRGDAGLDDTAEFSPTVTVDGIDLDVDAASGYSQTNRRRLYLASTSGVSVGVQYRLSNATGQSEIVTPRLVASNDYVDLDDELAYDYASSDSFQGVRMSFPVDATWVATESKILGGIPIARGDAGWGNATSATEARPSYKAVYSYTIASVPRRHYVYLRLVRQRSTHGVTHRDVQKYIPEVLLAEYRDRRGLQCADMIDAAWGEVRADILGDGYSPEQIRDAELLNLLVTLKTVQMYSATGIAPGGWDPRAYYELVATPAYANRYGKAIGNLRVDIDQGTDGGVTEDPHRAMWFRS